MSNSLPLVPGVQVRALEALATYRFLTLELMTLCGVGRDEKHLRAQLRAMEGKGWIGSTPAKDAEFGGGRNWQMFWLRPAGAKAMLKLLRLKQAPVPVEKEPTLRDERPHRLAIVETHIRLRQWAAATGITVASMRTEHGPGRSRENKETAVPYLDTAGKAVFYTPDALAELVPADGIVRPVVIEVYRGGWRNTLDHFKEKLPELREVSEGDVIDLTGLTVNPAKVTVSPARFLVVFMDDAMRDKALRWWPDPGAEVWGRFFVKALPELAGDFAGGWWQPGRPGMRRPLF